MLAYVKALRDHWDAFARGVNKMEILDILSRNTTVKDQNLMAQFAPWGLTLMATSI